MALEYYAYVNAYHIEEPKHKQEESKDNILPLIINDAKDITLASYEPMTKDLITAHRLSDYRRKIFTLLLLPDVDIMYDSILKGVYDL